MPKAAKKYTAALLAGLLLALSLALPVRSAGVPDEDRLPYALRAAFFRADRADAAHLPGEAGAGSSVFLAITAMPREPGVSLYASASQAQGKVTEIFAAMDGEAVRSRVLFPKGAEKPDPLVPGAATRMFEGAFTALVPLPDAAIGKKLDARLTGLACSAVNCTPIVLARTLAVPDAPALGALPDAAAAPWWDALLGGVAEPMGTPPAGFGAVPLAVGSSGIPAKQWGRTPLTVRETGRTADSPAPGFADGAFLRGIRPEPFTPGLEVRSMGKAVLFGFLAGFLLNLMPCVLPVLGIKLASLLAREGDTPEGLRRFRRRQVVFALGILAWFMVMAGLFHSLNLAWGQIFQSSAVVFALTLVLLFLALSLFGLFSLPLLDLRADKVKNPDIRAFAEGFGATLLATPCGGPLLGGVLSWALMQPFGVLALTLTFVGLGMASPYLALAAFPALAARLPRPGGWMRTMEHVLGFLLLGAVAYLVGFLPSDILPRAVASLVLAAFGVWLWRGGRPARIFGAACVVAACVWPFMARPAPGGWAAYSHAALGEVLGKRTVLVDFTADWCPTCKVVEAAALREKNLRAWEKEYSIALLRVDMTRENPEGEALLRAVGSVSIPVIAVFRKGEAALSPFVLRDIVTTGQIAAALRAANGG